MRCLWTVEAPRGQVVEWYLPKGYTIAAPCSDEPIPKEGGEGGSDRLDIFELGKDNRRLQTRRGEWYRCGSSYRAHQGRTLRASKIEIAFQTDAWKRREGFSILVRSGMGYCSILAETKKFNSNFER